MTSDEWLANNAFECKHLAARFTVDQCKANQQRAMHVQFPGLLAPCIACGGEDRMAKTKVVEQKTKRPYNRKAKPPEAEPKQVPVVGGEPQEFVHHSAPIAQLDPKRTFDESAAAMIGEVSASAGMRSLLYFLDSAQAAPPQPLGFFLDFTGHEQLLAHVQALSDDINSDMIALLTSLLDGELCRRSPVGNP